MSLNKKILVVFGTRPEAIKMAPLVKALCNDVSMITKVCVTAQHRSMLDQVLDIFDIKPDYDLNLMMNSQSLEQLSTRILLAISEVLEEMVPDLVLVHGDTTTTSMVSLACFYRHIPIGHVEAGLRTGNLQAPWPEEFNRRLTGMLSTLHFAPTVKAAENLLSEKIDPENIEITGNTVIDALFQMTDYLKNNKIYKNILNKKFNFIDRSKKLILVTGHRRENFGQGMIEICNALKEIGLRSDIQIIYAVHLNPHVKGPVDSILSNIPNIYLIPPQDYMSFVYLLTRCYIVLTDSGGIQEEAPSLGKPVLVMRETTERPEAVEAGAARLVGTKSMNIVAAVENLLNNMDVYEEMANANNPYGDGSAAKKITKRILKYFE